MDQGIGPTIGERITQLRKAAGLSQSALAAAAGVSPDLIRKLEQGRRHTLSIASLHAIARALDVDAGEILPKRPVTSSAPPSTRARAGAVALRKAVTTVDDLIGEDPDVEPLTLAAARAAVDFGWASYWAGRMHDELPQQLPMAITQVRATLRTVQSDEVPLAHDLAAEIYQLAACTLVHLGYVDSAHSALREALALAAQGTDELRPYALRSSMAWLLLNQGRFIESHKVATAAAAGVAPSGDSPMAEWTLYGSLLLSGATAAARAQDRPTAGVLLDEAAEAATRTGWRDDYQLAFGPEQVLMQTVDVDVVTENYTRALDTADRMPASTRLPLAARARHLADTALAHTRLGRYEAATSALMRIRETAPDWLRGQRQTQQIVRELRDQAASQPRLLELAKHTGLLK
ncbi:helix-turn-helix domain-containing protein (plasmid) [Pseudonocardia sp. DSM 110487]|uniref:helix-turn-helix domain-containing protein n=1 Tax=Pseudonocardia sp. DSM 110487 TaxID=2865833 RepID=UPI001C69756E|nr:helix-turn-helix domain-containing protein [Pseudonocardia sp. DSM 110487]QYN41139.1 helix-turn-helix domain-containing protein [Pseudonocardia sp. DSM 110487]